jgi:heat shock protein HtpX
MDSFLSQEPVLVFDRIEANRRKTLLLLVVFAILSLPFALYVSQYLIFLLSLFFLPIFFRGIEFANHIGLTLAMLGYWALLLVGLAAYLVYCYCSRIVLHITGARMLESEEMPDFRRVVENLCIGSGLPQPKLMVMDTKATNAFSTGITPDDATLVVTQGLFEVLERRELEGVIAQELSQIGNYDIRLNTVLAALMTVMLWPLQSVKTFFRALWNTPSGGWLASGCLSLVGAYLTIAILGGLISLFLIIGEPGFGFVWVAIMLLFFILFGAPIICLFVYKAISREREFLADADAVLLTRNPAGLAQALGKMGVMDNAKMQVNPATANLYIVNPLHEGHGFWDRLISSHPALEERIELLARMGGVTPEMLERAREVGKNFSEVSESPHAPPPKAITKDFSLKNFFSRVLAFWFGIGLLWGGLSDLCYGIKRGTRLDAPMGALVAIVFGVFLLFFGVGGQRWVDSIFKMIKNFGDTV